MRWGDTNSKPAQMNIEFPRVPFYYVRHGRTEANARELMAGGGWDVELDEVGKTQARTLAAQAQRLFRGATALYVSPMKRAQQTAKLLNAKLELPLHTHDGLREWHVGEWERKPWKEMPDPFLTEDDPRGGETRAEFRRRVRETFCEILAKPGPVLIAAHGGVWHVLANLMGLGFKPIDNCAAYRVAPVDARPPWSFCKVALDGDTGPLTR